MNKQLIEKLRNDETTTDEVYSDDSSQPNPAIFETTIDIVDLVLFSIQ